MKKDTQNQPSKFTTEQLLAIREAEIASVAERIAALEKMLDREKACRDEIIAREVEKREAKRMEEIRVSMKKELRKELKEELRGEREELERMKMNFERERDAQKHQLEMMEGLLKRLRGDS